MRGFLSLRRCRGPCGLPLNTSKFRSPTTPAGWVIPCNRVARLQSKRAKKHKKINRADGIAADDRATSPAPTCLRPRPNLSNLFLLTSRPGINCVMFAAPKQSTVDIVQTAGRVIRKAEGKKRGYLVILVVVAR